jgi:hypothetical protein
MSSRRSICAHKPPHPSNMLNHEQVAKETASQTLQRQIPVNINLVGPKLPICSCWLGSPVELMRNAWQSGRSSAVVIREPGSIFSSVLQRI